MGARINRRHMPETGSVRLIEQHLRQTPRQDKNNRPEKSDARHDTQHLLGRSSRRKNRDLWAQSSKLQRAQPPFPASRLNSKSPTDPMSQVQHVPQPQKMQLPFAPPPCGTTATPLLWAPRLVGFGVPVLNHPLRHFILKQRLCEGFSHQAESDPLPRSSPPPVRPFSSDTPSVWDLKRLER